MDKLDIRLVSLFRCTIFKICDILMRANFHLNFTLFSILKLKASLERIEQSIKYLDSEI